MKRLGVFVLLLGLAVPSVYGQAGPGRQQAKQLAPLPNVVSNQVQVLEAAGDSLWSDPLLTLYLEPEDRPRPQDSLLTVDDPALTEEDNVVFSIAARNEAQRAQVWAGLAFDTGGGEPGTGGFLVSTDGGASFDRRSPSLDDPSNPDTTLRYGVSTLPVVPITQQVGSTPQDLALGPTGDTAWVAGVRSGLRWSTDQGETWSRAVLPPDTSRTIRPSVPNDLLVAPRLGDGRGHLNHVVYSVLVDETGTVWAGTQGGLNRSLAGGVTPERRRGWRRYSVTDSVRGPTGNFVVSLAEQPRPGGRNPIWAATWGQQRENGAQLGRFGVAVTTDGGQTFRQALFGERIFDLAARRDRVYAAGESGLFVTTNRGRTWRLVETFPLQDDEQTLPSNVTLRAVAATDAALWVGTDEGLLRLDRNEEPALRTGRPAWRLYRTETPVNPDEPSEQVPDVSTYAYPNPFVPAQDEVVRIAYELSESQTVEVTIHDFRMNEVRTFSERKAAGQQETVWDGTDAQGLRVPTGTYFYTVELGDQTVNGKILVAN